MAELIHHHTFANGLTLLAERMPHVRSVSMNLSVRAGAAHDPDDRLGMASVLSELVMRGAGERDFHQLQLALDNLGLDYDHGVGPQTIRFSGSTLGRNLPSVLPIYADLMRRAHLPEAELPAVRSLALQDLHALEDEPRTLTLIELRKRNYPGPVGRDSHGTVEGIEALTIDELRAHYRRYFTPQDTILSIAGDIDWPRLRDQVGECFGDWTGEAVPLLDAPRPSPSYTHIDKPGQQTHLALACESVPITHPDYYLARAAVSILSDGMSARLFTEVREKRGLCYAVYATHEMTKQRGCVLAYAACLSGRAAQTLEVTLHELQRLAAGIEADEVQRVQVGLKSALIMHQESTAARAAWLSADWFSLGRVRSLAEVEAAVEALTAAAILDHLHRHPYQDFTIVTLGPEPVR